MDRDAITGALVAAAFGSAVGALAGFVLLGVPLEFFLTTNTSQAEEEGWAALSPSTLCAAASALLCGLIWAAAWLKGCRRRDARSAPGGYLCSVPGCRRTHTTVVEADCHEKAYWG